MSNEGRVEAATRIIWAQRTSEPWNPDERPLDTRKTIASVEEVLAAADGWDRDHGWTRVNTRDEAAIGRALEAVLAILDELRPGDWMNVKYAWAAIDAVVSGLAGGSW